MSIQKTIFGFIAMGLLSTNAIAQKPWKQAPLQLATRWSKDVSPQNALPEYPRPQMVRDSWTNLNGLWEYAITEVNAAPEKYDGQILVPYPLESALSGVQKHLEKDQYLWYKRKFTISKKPSEQVLLHFGAVDNVATVFVNGQKTGDHAGGYTAFSIDITSALKEGENEVVVKVADPTDQGVYPHGKQVSNPASIYYTASSGIWQTVWLEVLPIAYISALNFTPDLDRELLQIRITAPAGHTVQITAMDGDKKAGSVKGNANTTLLLPIKDAKLWSPDAPFLYDLQVKLLKGNKVVDEVRSYAGMRKVAVCKDEHGFSRICLNNKYVYNLGTLDQGFWPDGLYTAPTDEALAFDIKAIKAMGFNTIRKHIKVEPARWYYHADKLGMLVWQDFVNPAQSLPEGAKPAFEKQLDETMVQLHDHPSIITWVLFNEKWGQYDQQRLTEYVRLKDPSRLLNAHSGELLWVNEQLRSPSPDAWVSSEIADIHSYPDPMNAPVKEGRVQVLGEFGGIGVFIPDHQWVSGKSWGYVQVTPSQLLGKYAVMNQHLQLLEKEGLSASIYTQPFDVEGEENGIMTYDREVIKMPFDELRKIHAHLVSPTPHLPEITAQPADITDPALVYSRQLQAYIDGNREPAFLQRLLMLASQTGDKNGIARIGNAWVTALKAPLSTNDMQLVSSFTKSTTDNGFALIKTEMESFRRWMGDREFAVYMMGLIYTGEMKVMIEDIAEPDWAAIEKKIRPYGDPGEEIFLRAKVVHFVNKQDWANYVPVAKTYIEKYGAYLPENEKQFFIQAIDQHGQ